MSVDQDDMPEVMSASQLANRTGVPVRRIRFYVAEGLLSPPQGRGRAAHYTTAHLERLQQIIALRESNLGLDEIKERLGDPDTSSTAQNMTEPLASNWQRWEVVPGVEIHARDDLDEQTLATVRVMIGVVRNVLEQGELPVRNWVGQDE
jgi:DNA-binding transcriptional MerR regulator